MNWWAKGTNPNFVAATSRVERGSNGQDRVAHVPWKEPLQQAFIEAADMQWQARVQSVMPSQTSGQGGNKLRTYARFKTSISQEAYISVSMGYEARRLLCRFRIGVAPLQVEIGRRHQQGEGSRACHVCGHDREDEEHFLMACPLYAELR